jgi:hypothetical protein
VVVQWVRAGWGGEGVRGRKRPHLIFYSYPTASPSRPLCFGGPPGARPLNLPLQQCMIKSTQKNLLVHPIKAWMETEVCNCHETYTTLIGCSSTQLTHVLFICSGRQLPSARQQGVFAYPKQRATVSVGSVLK